MKNNTKLVICNHANTPASSRKIGCPKGGCDAGVSHSVAECKDIHNCDKIWCHSVLAYVKCVPVKQ